MGVRRSRAFRVASWVTLVAWLCVTVCALVIATFGVIGLTGSGDYRYRTEAGVGPLTVGVGFQPSWSVTQSGDVCAHVNVRSPSPGC